MIQKTRTFILVTAFLQLFSLNASATHIVGGEMTYTCLGNDQYRITLTIFRDCINGNPWFDLNAAIGVFDSNNILVSDSSLAIALDPMLNDTLDPDLGSDCFVNVPDVCIHTTTYDTVLTLPFRPGGYQIVYQRCCRNFVISNIYTPDDIGATYSIDITEEALLQCNSSPKFNNWPPIFICLGYPFEIDQSATDTDGDSLVYKLCNPLSGANQPSNPVPKPPNSPPYDTVPWIDPPFNVFNMLNAVPGGVPMSIDPQTGILQGVPNTSGQFVIGICVEEYRNGQLIGVSRRDYQVIVGECEVATASFFVPEVICEGNTVVLDNQSLIANHFLWLFNDPANPGASSTHPEPTYTYSDTGLYTITLIAEPGTFCSDTFETQIQILPHSISADFSFTVPACSETLSLEVQDLSTDGLYQITGWDWTVINETDTFYSTLQQPSFELSQEGSATIALTVTSESGCRDTILKTIPVSFILDEVEAVNILCLDQDESIQLNTDGYDVNAVYIWEPPDFLDDPQRPDPVCTPGSSITYLLTIRNPETGCEVEKTVAVILSPEVTVSPVLDTLELGSSVQIRVEGDSSFIYNWSPPDFLDLSAVLSPIATPENDIVYTLFVTDLNGCTSELTVTLIVIPPVCAEPYLFIPTGFSPNGDGKNDEFRVFGNNIEELYLAVYNRWGELIFETTRPDEGWDGTFRGKRLPPDAFAFYVNVTCAGGQTFFKKGNVTLIR